MSETPQGYQTPLLDLLRKVPKDGRAIYEHGPTHSQSVPYGRLCHEAADALAAEREARERAELKVETYEAVHALMFERLPSAQALGELPGAVDEMLAEAERLREDAERYRWLRRNPNFMGWEHDFLYVQVDAAIDATRKEGT
jgi:hypothetical protein